MDYMFNELSMQSVDSIQEVRNILLEFVKSSIKASELGLKEMRLFEQSISSLFQINLHSSYNIYKWLADNEVDNDLRIRFKEIITTFPLVKKEEIIESDIYSRSEFFKNINGTDSVVWGLGAAYVFNTLSIGLATHIDWEKENITIRHYSIDLQDNENTAYVEVGHFSNCEILEKHREWIEKKQKDGIRKSKELWNNRHTLFPIIQLGLGVEDDLQKMGLSKKFELVIDSLKKLNNYAISWKSGGFSISDIQNKTLMDISGESSTTMNKYSSLRRFYLAASKKAQFELHIKIKDIRIYFLPDESTHTITVGYIGKHLRTATFD